jgi:eukaryotic-like serine/threonine-protein kinase
VFHRLSYRTGEHGHGRVAPDGSVYVGARFPGEAERNIYVLVPGQPELRRMDIPGATDVCAVGRREILVLLSEASRPLRTLARVPLAGGQPRPILEDTVECDLAPDDEALAVLHVEKGRSRIEFPLGQTVYESADRLGWLDVSLDGRRVAFTHHPVHGFSIGEVMVAERGRPARSISRRFQSIYGLAWSPRGEVWVTASDVGTRHPVLALSLDGRDRRVAESTAQLVLLDMSPDGRALLAADAANPQLRFKRAGEPAERDLTWLDASWLRQITADGSKLLVVEDEDGGATTARTYLRPTDGKDPVLLALGLGSSLSRDGKWILVTPRDSSGAIDVVPVGAGVAQPLAAAVPGRRAEPVWFPDGEDILYQGWTEAGLPQLYVQRRGQATARPLGGPGLQFYGEGAISADGQRVIVTDEDHRWLVLPVAAAEPLPIAGLLAGESCLRWTDDDQHIFTVRVDADNLLIDRVDPTTGARADVVRVPNGRSIDSLAMTPDGRAYAYRLQPFGSQLYLLEEGR